MCMSYKYHVRVADIDENGHTKQMSLKRRAVICHTSYMLTS